MPRKMRQLRAELQKAGAFQISEGGALIKWRRSLEPSLILLLSGHDNDNAKSYQEKIVRDLLQQVLVAKRWLVMNEVPLHYSMLIEWSDEDQVYLVILPEWAELVVMPVAHGNTYEEAVEQGQAVLEVLIKSVQKDGEALPAPKVYTA